MLSLRMILQQNNVLWDYDPTQHKLYFKGKYDEGILQLCAILKCIFDGSYKGYVYLTLQIICFRKSRNQIFYHMHNLECN